MAFSDFQNSALAPDYDLRFYFYFFITRILILKVLVVKHNLIKYFLRPHSQKLKPQASEIFNNFMLSTWEHELFIWIKDGDVSGNKEPLVIGLLAKIKPNGLWNDCVHKKACNKGQCKYNRKFSVSIESVEMLC